MSVFSIISKLFENIIFAPFVTIFYLALSYIIIKLLYNKNKIKICLRKTLFKIFNFFSSEIFLINMIQKISKEKYFDISILLYTNIFNLKSSPKSSESVGTAFIKKLNFRCYIDFLTNEFCINLTGLNNNYYSINEKRISLSKIIPFNKKNERLIDIVINYYIEYINNINLSESIEFLLNDHVWDNNEKEGLKKIYNDQMNNLI